MCASPGCCSSSGPSRTARPEHRARTSPPSGPPGEVDLREGVDRRVGTEEGASRDEDTAARERHRVRVPVPRRRQHRPALGGPEPGLQVIDAAAAPDRHHPPVVEQRRAHGVDRRLAAQGRWGPGARRRVVDGRVQLVDEQRVGPGHADQHGPAVDEHHRGRGWGLARYPTLVQVSFVGSYSSAELSSGPALLASDPAARHEDLAVRQEDGRVTVPALVERRRRRPRPGRGVVDLDRREAHRRARSVRRPVVHLRESTHDEHAAVLKHRGRVLGPRG